MNEFLKAAQEAATSAGNYINQAADKIDQLQITQKSLHDYVSDVDRNSEKIITELIRDRFPKHQILGEEYGVTGESDSEYQWIVDPLDGTTNFLRSIPHYAVSIAMLHRGETVIGVVHDPVKQDLFSASKGQGTTLNNVQISVSQRDSIKGALLATGIPFSGHNLAHISSFSSSMENLLALQTSGIRRLGSAALDLAYIACGRYDGYWEANLQAWDIAAGALLVTEAGGIVTELNGGNEYLSSGNILAANQQVHRSMLSVTDACYVHSN